MTTILLPATWRRVKSMTEMMVGTALGDGSEEIVKNKVRPLVQVRNLKKYFAIKGKGMLHAVDDISFDIYPGETLGLVGESGCGKSTVGNVLVRLHKPTAGEMIFNDVSVFKANDRQGFDLCKKMQIIFQDPYSSLNPRKTIKMILKEAYEIHNIAKGSDMDQRILTLCAETGINEEFLNKYPHELDGGNRQIVGIARALSLSPEFVVCDEPVSSLDVSIQATIINLLMDLQRKKNLAFLFISHDLSVVRHISNRIAVMYLGQIIELADTDEIFSNTLHPYSIALLSAVPKVEIGKKVSRIVLKGDVPSPLNPTEGCRFAPRCWMAQEICKTKTPPLIVVNNKGHKVACHFWQDSQAKALEAQKHRERELLS
jgi:oligopeptide/dipeptide ABC transporter ATP-binding protein